MTHACDAAQRCKRPGYYASPVQVSRTRSAALKQLAQLQLIRDETRRIESHQGLRGTGHALVSAEARLIAHIRQVLFSGAVDKRSIAALTFVRLRREFGQVLRGLL